MGETSTMFVTRLGNTPPAFYGVVEPCVNYVFEGSSPVEEWYEKKEVNVLSSACHYTPLTLCSYSLTDNINDKPLTEDDFSRWFDKVNM